MKINSSSPLIFYVTSDGDRAYIPVLTAVHISRRLQREMIIWLMEGVRIYQDLELFYNHWRLLVEARFM